jgi:glutamine amidotransferase
MTSPRAVVVDYGIGNVFSVCQAVKHAGGEPILTGDPATVASAERLILPGVGAFGRAIDELGRLGLADVVREFTGTGRPFIGLCVGMQLLFDGSTEFGSHPGLGLIPGTVDRISSTAITGEPLRVPHIGWNELTPPAHRTRQLWAEGLLADINPRRSAFYFVHSYAARPSDPATVIAEAVYGGNPIVAAVQLGNIAGVQFHPERSGEAGQKVLRRFLAS